jgi:chemotaxis protein CheD
LKHIVGVGDMCVSSQPYDLIITYALGSCLGLTVYDPVAGVGGLLHMMLPLSEIDAVKAKENPCMFVDTGVPMLFQECYKAGARKERMAVKVAGGATAKVEGQDFFQIGKRNFIILRKLLWKNGLLIKSEDVGGFHSRTMSLEIGTGVVTIKSNGTSSIL